MDNNYKLDTDIIMSAGEALERGNNYIGNTDMYTSLESLSKITTELVNGASIDATISEICRINEQINGFKQFIKDLLIESINLSLLEGKSIYDTDITNALEFISSIGFYDSCKTGLSEKSNQSNPVNAYSYSLSHDGMWAKQYKSIVNKYFPDYDEEDVLDMLIALKHTGCGFSSLSNCVYELYSGKEEEYLNDFGFPMHVLDENGDIVDTYNFLEVDLFCSAYKNNINKASFLDSILYGLDSKAKSNTKENLNKLYNFEYDADMGDKILINGVQTRLNELDKIVSTYHNDIEIEVSYPKSWYLGFNTIDKVRNELNEGNEIILAASTYDLTDELGNTYSHRGGHAMQISGVTDDNQLIINTWGETYTLDPKSLGIGTEYHIVKKTTNE